MKKEIIFITGNEDKFREFKQMLTYVELKRENLDLPELQGSPEKIVKEKAKLACKIIGKPCFVDDTSLCFEEWGCLPGSYIKHFLKEIGNEKLAKILLNSFKNNKAKAITSIGYCEPGKESICIQGITKGEICLPRGKSGFKNGWDKIFIPEGEKKTYAEISSEEKNKISQRKKAIIAFEKFLESL
jgi:inosine triphosphate pyrophosphatase